MPLVPPRKDSDYSTEGGRRAAAPALRPQLDWVVQRVAERVITDWRFHTGWEPNRLKEVRMGVRAFTWRARRFGVQLVSPIWITLVLVHGLLVPLGGCGGGGNPATDLVAAGVEYSGASGAGGREPPTAIELEAALGRELERLGIDPARAISAAPSAGNSVFDLTARIVEAEELEEGSPAGVVLSWTERLTGDYDLSGTVDMYDITPIAVNWERRVDYLEAPLVGGLEWWPAGLPDDGGEVQPAEPPLAGSGAENWRLARVDGNFDTLINASDLTPLAQHWQEHLDGYRVYRRIAGGQFEPLDDPDAPGQFLIVRRATAWPEDAEGPDKRWPVRYRWFDAVAASGSFEYCVVPYCAESVQEGPWSRTALALRNQPPEAILEATAASAGGPLYTFDASASHDTDGAVVSFRWDFDGDGEYEHNSGTVPRVEHRFDRTGLHIINLRIMDDSGAGASATTTVYVETLMAAVFTAAPDTGTAPLWVTFDPTSSYAPGGITIYQWDFEGDGEWDVTTAYPNIQQHRYEEGGIYEPRLLIRDGWDREAETTAAVAVSTGSTSRVRAIPAAGPRPLEVEFRADAYDVSYPRHFEWDLDGDYEYETDGGISGVITHVFDTIGAHWVCVRITGGVGELLYDGIEVMVHAPPVAVLEYNLLYGSPWYQYSLVCLNSYDPDGEIVKYVWDFEGDGTWDEESGPGIQYVVHSYNEPPPHKPRLRVIDDMGYWDEAEAYIDHPIPYDPPTVSLEANHTLGSVELEVTFLVAATLPEHLEVEKLELHTDDGGYYDLGDDLISLTVHTYQAGSYRPQARLTTSDAHVYTDFANIYVMSEVAVIRNDGGIYDANHDALISDLEQLNLQYTEWDWYAGIPADLDPAVWAPIIWYRGGPGADSEPQVYTTPWTDPEIDDYIQLLKDGHRVLLMSQSHGRNPFADGEPPPAGDGWENWYGAEHGWQVLSGSIEDDDIRHPWAASLGPGKAIAGTGDYGHLESAPRNILATTEFGGKGQSDGYDYEGYVNAERYNGAGGSGDIPITYSFGPGRQFTGIGYYSPFMKYHPYPNAGKYFVAGVNLDPAFEAIYDLAYVSYGNLKAPDEDIGYHPDYTHTSGPGLLWVVCYPWAETTITHSSNGGMTRAMLLQNIVGWLLVGF